MCITVEHVFLSQQMFGGVARQLEDKKGEEYADLANWLEKSFPSRYSRGVHYLRQLSGEVAMPQETLPRLTWLPPSQIQLGAPRRVVLPDPLECDTHNLRVQFHRL